MSMRSAKPRAGFTLIELLVVIVIIAILVSLLMYAVQAARLAANNVTCLNNMRQLATACRNYESLHKYFPPAMSFESGQNAVNSTRFKMNWIGMILPQMELKTLYDSYNKTKLVNDPENLTYRSTKLGFLLCPMELNSSTPFSGDGGGWARGSYAANVGHGRLDSSNGPTSSNWSNPQNRGVMGWNSSIGSAHIRDGATNTILLAEVRVGLTAIDRRGTWAMGTAGASAIVWCGFGGDANGPNPCNDSSDDVQGCDQMDQAHNLENCMSCWQPCPSYQAAPRSVHAPEGVHVAMADGSAHFLTNLIDIGTGPWSTCCSTWDRLIGATDSLPLDRTLIGF